MKNFNAKIRSDLKRVLEYNVLLNHLYEDIKDEDSNYLYTIDNLDVFLFAKKEDLKNQIYNFFFCDGGDDSLSKYNETELKEFFFNFSEKQIILYSINKKNFNKIYFEKKNEFLKQKNNNNV